MTMREATTIALRELGRSEAEIQTELKATDDLTRQRCGPVQVMEADMQLSFNPEFTERQLIEQIKSMIATVAAMPPKTRKALGREIEKQFDQNRRNN